MACALWRLSMVVGIAAQLPPNYYGGAAPAPPAVAAVVQPVAAVIQAPVAAPAAAAPTGPTGAPTHFNPMAFNPNAAAPVTGTGTGVTDALNAAMTGDKAAMAANTQAAIAQAPEATGQVVEGFIEGYFANVKLAPGEKVCIKQNVHKVTSDGVGIITEMSQVISQLVAKQTPNVLGLMGGVGQVVEIVTAVQHLIKGCVQKDAVDVMDLTLKHLKDPTYVKGRFLANGLDIAKVLADAVPSWEASNFQKVGSDFGTLVRKILLSDSSGMATMVLPAGMQQNEVGEAVIEGVIEGLFVVGSSITITDTVDPSIHIFVDLHRCIAKEAPYFSMVGNALYVAISAVSANIAALQEGGKQSGMNISEINTQTNWMGQLSGVLTNIPSLMDRCGLNTRQRLMMSKAIKGTKTVSVALDVPGPETHLAAANQAAKKFVDATAAWKVGKYNKFGKLMGNLIRDLLLASFPDRLYTEGGPLKNVVAEKSNESSGSLAVLVGGSAAVMLIGLSLFRVSRPSSRSAALLQAEVCVEEDGTAFD